VTRVVGLGGGIGASRLWRALAQAVPQQDLTLIVNTGDDLWLHGLRVCPDLDTTLYALSGEQDAERGWGRKGETWRCRDALRELGEQVWFNLGDRDLATHLWRTGLFHDGAGLSAVTTGLATIFGVAATVLPMTEDEVTTYVDTAAHALLHYEEYLVRYRAEPDVRGVEHRGVDRAIAAPGVLDAIAAADLIVLAPSNPVASIAPILGLPGVREALLVTAAPVIAVSPLVLGRAITDPGEERRAASRNALMAAVGKPADPAGVAAMYAGFCDRFVLDLADESYAANIRSLGVDVAVAPTLLHTGEPPEPLLDVILGAGAAR
jgi:LPPG:FO 2-phospho-L-lactate transferase